MVLNNHQFRCNIAKAALACVTATALFLSIGCEDNNPASATSNTPNQQSAANKAGSTSNHTSANNPTAAGPQLTFDKYEHDFGNILDTQPSVGEFTFTNTGNEELVIQNVRPSCGCTVPDLEKNRFAPGEGSSLKITFNPRGSGQQSKTITVLSNDRDNSPLTLTISANVTPFVNFEPQILRPTLTIGEPFTTTVNLTPHDPNAEILTVRGTGGDGHISARLLPKGESDSGREHTRQIEVTIDNHTEWGPLYGSVTVQVRGRPHPNANLATHDARLSIIAAVYGEIHGSNHRFAIGDVASGRRINATVKLYRPSGEPFEITDLVVKPQKMPGVQVEKRRIQNDPSTPGYGYELILTGDTSGYTGSVRGDVIVHTDVPGEEQIELSYFGRVR